MRIFHIFTLVFVLSISFACTSNKNQDPEKTYHGYLTDDPKTLDPAVAYDAIAWDVMGVVYETLYQYSYLKDPYEVEPLLAADLPKYSKDGKTVEIPIRQDVYYHGTKRKLKAEDFITAWKRMAIPSIQAQGFWLFEGRIVGFDDYKKKVKEAKDKPIEELLKIDVPGFQAKDDHTLIVKLTRPYPQFLYILTLPFTSPLPLEILKDKMDEKGNINETLIGTGPFYMQQWKRGNVIILDKSSDFHPDFYPTKGNQKFKKEGLFVDAGKLLPLMDRVKLRIIKEEQPAWLEFLSGKLDKTQIPKDSYGEAITNKVELTDSLKEKKIQLASSPEASFYYLHFNMKDEVIGKDKKLRQLISQAIDREEFITLFLNGRGTKMTHSLPPGIPDRLENPKLKYDYAPQRIAQYKPKKIELTLDLPDSTSFSRQLGEFLARQLKPVGIQLKVVFNTSSSIREKIKNAHYQIGFSRWILDYPDAENVYQLLYGPNAAPGPNATNFNHPRFNELYRITADMNPSPKRMKLISEMDAIIQEELPWIYLTNRIAFRLHQNWLKNYRQAEMILNKFKYYRVDPELKH